MTQGSAVMMLSRECKRVPLDFDAPLGQVWTGYVMADTLRPAGCPTCGPHSGGGYGGDGYGDGLTPEARAIDQTFYAHMIGGPRANELAWHDKLGQAEVDNLVAEGYLRVLKDREPTDDNPRNWEWVSVPRAAAEVNAANGPGASMLGGHDACARWKLCEFRCKVLGIARACPTCGGDGYIFANDEQRETYDGWEPTEPPTGAGYQLWESVSEGSPVSPVFADVRRLAEWLSVHDDSILRGKSAEDWLAILGGDVLGRHRNDEAPACRKG